MSEVQGNIIEGNEQAQETEPTTQVYKVTHKENGDRRSFMDRSFISFSYGGKWIEDFNFIVSIDGDRMQRNAYADFSDIVSESDVIDGQLFWSTHFNNNSLDLVLATDEVDEKTWEEFKAWFKPGVAHELILSEHPNRAIMARVSAVPQQNVLPFEKETTVKIVGIPYKTKTTVYRGTVTLSFVMDNPYWYAISNILYYENGTEKPNYDKFLNANGIDKYIFDDPDAIKIILEDGVVANTMLKDSNMLIGSNVVIDGNNISNTQIAENNGVILNPDSASPATIYDEAETEDDDTYRGHIGPLFKEIDGGLNLKKDEEAYFYYGGTAPSKPILSFTLIPKIGDNSLIVEPKNIYDEKDNPYNFIKIQSINTKEFRFTTPSIWTAYNQAIKIMKEFEKSNDKTILELKEEIRKSIKHYAVRNYIINGVCYNMEDHAKVNTSKPSEYMIKFLGKTNNDTGEFEIFPADFIFNSKTGKAIGKFKYFDGHDLKVITENVGDMVRSDYLIIEDRNYPSKEGYIEKWRDKTPKDIIEDPRKYSHKLWHNMTNITTTSPRLTKLLLTYTNMYL